MARRTSFGPDMGNTGWTPIDDEDWDSRFFPQPAAVTDLTLPSKNGRAYAEIGDGMYMPVRKQDDMASENNKWENLLPVPFTYIGSLPSSSREVPPGANDKIVHPGWQPRENGIGGTYNYARRQFGDFGTVNFLNAEASAGGDYRSSRDAAGKLNGIDMSGDARIGGNLLTIDGSTGPQKWGEAGGNFKILNAGAEGRGYARFGSDISENPGAGVNGNAEVSMFQGDANAKVRVPFTYLNNRMRAFNMLFGGGKGPRKDVDLVLEGQANGGFGARAGCDINEKTFMSPKNLKDVCYWQPWFFGGYSGNAYISDQAGRR